MSQDCEAGCPPQRKVIKLINRRVKESEKFWSERGAEAILQLQTDSLSKTEAISRFWRLRGSTACGFRPYRRAA